jgi:hypothetical protein
MATSTNSNVIDRESSNMSLADRYLSGQPAGGAYQPVQKNVQTGDGSNQLSVGTSKSDVQYTSTKGFKLRANTGTENFNNVALNYSDTINGGVKTDGVNKISTNWNGQASVKDTLFTVDQGFKIKSAIGQTQYKDAVGSTSKQLSLYIKGFNNKKYIDGKFTR